MRKSLTRCLILIVVAVAASCVSEPPLPSLGPYLVDSGGRRIDALDVGASMETGARGLEPLQQYDFELTIDGEQVSFARLTAGSDGEIPAFHLWFHSGVVGCSLRQAELEEARPFMFRDFDEAAEALAGRRLTLTIRKTLKSQSLAGGIDAAGDETAHRDRQSVEAQLDIPVRARQSAMVFPSTGDGCLLNSAAVGEDDMFVSGRHFEPGEWVEVSVAPNQRLWRVGDQVSDVSGEAGAAEPMRVQADELGQFTVKVWDRDRQRHGAYDFVTRRRVADADGLAARLIGDEVISYGSDTAHILYLRYPPGGPHLDIAGRPLIDQPYFEFADSFAQTGDDVWGAVDPIAIPDDHPGGSYAAYYVVNHRNVPGWNGNTALADVSGGAEIMPIKVGCINATMIPIWPGNKTTGQYDVVVNFGSTPGETEDAFTDDSKYDSTFDFLDGADQIGFRVAKDPHERGTQLVGEAEYSVDDFLDLGPRVPTAYGLPANNPPVVDMRAVVRYPATTAGANTPVASGQHPLFIMLHGNTPDTCTDNIFDHASCPEAQRILNHRGYDELLNVLASHGIIAVSIDAYDLTGRFGFAALPPFIEERGDLILKHLELWAHLDDQARYPSYGVVASLLPNFQNRIDTTKISVSGHSRGGEAAVAAHLRNQDRPQADRFEIGSVSSIAPTDSLGYVLEDAPYFVIIPAADGDLADLDGVRLYDRAGGTLDNINKSSTYIYGAIHNYFNTVWAAGGPELGVWEQYIDAILDTDQQRLGEAYIAAFARSHLIGEDVYEDMLRGRLTFPSTAGYEIHHVRHERTHLKIDAGTGAGAPEQCVVGGVPQTNPTVTSVTDPSVHQTQALKLEWLSTEPSGPVPAQLCEWLIQTASYKYTFSQPQDVSAFEVLSFRVAQTKASSNPVTGQDISVMLGSGTNRRAWYAGRFYPIPPPYDRRNYDGSDLCDGVDCDHTVMTTVRIPLQSFTLHLSGVELDRIDSVEFIFTEPAQGEVLIDDVEFSR